MPQEIIKEFIGKVCTIVAYGEIFGTTGKILEVQGNWIKVQIKKETKLINTDMVMNITMLPEKHQK